MLQARGLFRRDYQAHTLRGHPGLPGRGWRAAAGAGDIVLAS